MADAVITARIEYRRELASRIACTMIEQGFMPSSVALQAAQVATEIVRSLKPVEDAELRGDPASVKDRDHGPSLQKTPDKLD